MKKALVVFAVVIGLTLAVTAVYAQHYDAQMTASAMAKGKSFKFEGTVKSVDPNTNVVFVEINGKVAMGRFDVAKVGEEFTGSKGLKPGDKIKGEGKQVEGYNWVQKYEKVQ